MPTLTKTRYVPADYREHARNDATGAVVYFGGSGSTFLAIGFRSARQINHDFHCRFGTAERRAKYVADWIAGLDREVARKRERAAEKATLAAQPNPFRVGDVLHYSWGWEQTNPEFYQVVAVKPRSVVVREIGQQSVPSEGDADRVSPMAEYVTAVRDKFIGEPIAKTVKFYAVGKPYLPFDYGHASLWDGRKVYHSWYA